MNEEESRPDPSSSEGPSAEQFSPEEGSSEPDSPAAQPSAVEAGRHGAEFQPVAAGERYEAVDVLRGFSILGILVMNIYAYAMPFAAYNNPLLWGGEGIHNATWVFTHLFFDQKFMTIFAMLFGAGLVLMSERAEARGTKFAGVYYRRMLWLIVIGAVHGYLIWFGDILVNYACCGLLLYPLRRLRPRTLAIIAILFLMVPLPINRMMGSYFSGIREQAEAAEARLAAGETLTEEEEAVREGWEGMRAFMLPTRELIEEKVEIYRDGWVGVLKERAPVTFSLQTFLWFTFGLWRMGGMMMLGMALMKLGVFRAALSRKRYGLMLVAGYLVGLPIVATSARELWSHDFDFFYFFKIGLAYNYVGSIPVGLAHVALVMLAVRSGIFSGLRTRLAAVGRMALTNYLMHSVVMTLIFYGYGLGLYGHVERFWQMFFVLGMWLVQLYLSPWWLERYRFGPAEWLWRSLSYWRRQPMRAAVAAPVT